MLPTKLRIKLQLKQSKIINDKDNIKPKYAVYLTMEKLLPTATKLQVDDASSSATSSIDITAL